jgi:tRNA (cmo5U34)-methyltransferase
VDEPVFHPEGYLELMHEEIPGYERLQARLVDATLPVAARAILELGSGTGETTRRLLDAHPGASLVGIDASEEMLAAARTALAGRRVSLHRGRLEDPLPAGPFDLVASALAVHHLDGPAKAALFGRVAAVLRPGGRFALADVVVPEDAAGARVPLNEGFDLPSGVAEQEGWLRAAGLRPQVVWADRDIAVIAADRPG